MDPHWTLWVKSLLLFRYRTKLLRLVRSLLDSVPDHSILTDKLCGEFGLARFFTDPPQGWSRRDTHILLREALFGWSKHRLCMVARPQIAVL